MGSEREQIPSALDIALFAANVPDYSPMAELAKAACMIGTYYPYDMRMVAGVNMTAWQAKIAEAQFMALLQIGDHLPTERESNG